MQSIKPVVVVHVLAFVGVTFWVLMIAGVVTGAIDRSPVAVVVLGLVLGGTHLAISLLARARSARILPLIWFVLLADLALVLVDVRALVLVGASVVLLLAGRSCTRSWSGDSAVVAADAA